MSTIDIHITPLVDLVLALTVVRIVDFLGEVFIRKKAPFWSVHTIWVLLLLFTVVESWSVMRLCWNLSGTPKFMETHAFDGQPYITLLYEHCTMSEITIRQSYTVRP